MQGREEERKGFLKFSSLLKLNRLRLKKKKNAVKVE